MKPAAPPLPKNFNARPADAPPLFLPPGTLRPEHKRTRKERRALREAKLAADPSPATKPAKPRGLGDAVSSALAIVGVTEDRVSKWLGRDCGCGGRKAMLNKLGEWAARVLAGSREEPPIEDC